MKEYYNKNLTKFITPESKILKYVFFERRPSYDDTLEAQERIEDFVLRIKEGEDFLEVAKEVSDDSIIENNFQNINELSPYLTNIYQNLKNAEISDIIKAPKGFEVIKKVRKGLIYQVKTNIQISSTTLSEIHDQIISFKETVKEHGFESSAVDFNLTVRKTYPLNKDNLRFPVRNTDVLATYLSRAEKGKIAGPFSSFGGYYLFTLDSIIPEYKPKFEEIMSRIRMEQESEKLREEMAIYLDNISNQLKTGKTMEAVASTDTLFILRNDIKGATLTQINHQFGAEFTGVVATLEPNQVSPPLLMDWEGYIIRCDKKIVNQFDSTMVTALQMKRQMRLQQLTQNLFIPKDIEDNRDEFFE